VCSSIITSLGHLRPLTQGKTLHAHPDTRGYKKKKIPKALFNWSLTSLPKTSNKIKTSNQTRKHNKDIDKLGNKNKLKS
jgi:hypothetical protein